MDHIRTIFEKVDFVPYHYEYTFLAPSINRILVQDVHLSLHGSPSFVHPGGRNGVSAHDIRFYVDGHELTSYLIKGIHKSMDKCDQAKLKEEYSFSLTKWLELEEKMGAAYGTQDLAKEQAIAQQLLNTVPLSDTLNQFGDLKAGWGGNLHIFNFLYKEIEIPPVSLVEVLEAFKKDHASAIDPQAVKRLTFSSGPCRLFSTGWDPMQVPTGSIHCLFEIQVHNLLEDRVVKLEQQMEVLQTEITEALQNIDEAIRVETNERLRELRASVEKNVTNIVAVQSELKRHELQIAAIKDTSQEILKAVETI